MGKFDFTAKLGKTYSYNELNQLHGLNEGAQDEDKFQENMIYFIEEEIKTVEFWDPIRNESLILKDFMNLYDFDKNEINQSDLKAFIKTYGLPFNSEERGDNEFLQINFHLQEMSKDPRFFYSKLDLRTLKALILVFKKVLILADTKNPKSHEVRLANMLYLLTTPIIKEITKEIVTTNHIEEINSNIEFNEDVIAKIAKRTAIKKQIVLTNYKETLRRRIKECKSFKNLNGINKYKGSEKNDDLSGNIFTDINYINYNEILERAPIILEFLCMIEKIPYILFTDEHGLLIDAYIDIDSMNEAIINNDLIEQITPLFVTDYLTCLIKRYPYEVVKNSKNYYLKMHLDAFGAILYGLIYTLDANNYMRICPRCNKYFFPDRKHPNQRCCSHNCSDVYGKARKRAAK